MSAAAVLVGVPLPAVRTPGEVLRASLRTASRGMVFAELASADTVRLQDREVEESLEAVGRLAQAVARERLRLACEVAERGLHLQTGHRLTDWLALRCPELSGAALHDTCRLATASTEDVHAPLVAAVLSGGMLLERAARIHRALARVRRVLEPEGYAQAVDLLVQAGCHPLFDDPDIGRIIDKLLREVLPEKERDLREKKRREARNLYESSLAGGELRRIIFTFGSDEDYETVRAILMSPLSRPATAREQEETGQVDDRTPGQRRYDALMTVLRRGVAGTQGQPTTTKATVVVSIDFEVLQRLLADGAGGDTPGCGATLDGASVTAATIRRMACDADIIPVVLGTQGEVLDQGRAKRLVTPGQRIRLAMRDQTCTIPGCTVPATWCDAHHVVPWSRGGRSDLSNYALLCPRHHTWVHERELTATVTARGVTWHLR